MKSRYNVKQEILSYLNKFLSVDDSFVSCEEVKEQGIMLAEAYIENLHLMSKDYDCDPFDEDVRLHCLRSLPHNPIVKFKIRFKPKQGEAVHVTESLDLDMFLSCKDLSGYNDNGLFDLTEKAEMFLKSIASRLLDSKNTFLMDRKGSEKEIDEKINNR
jgi:hypothetical protein